MNLAQDEKLSNEMYIDEYPFKDFNPISIRKGKSDRERKGNFNKENLNMLIGTKRSRVDDNNMILYHRKPNDPTPVYSNEKIENKINELQVNYYISLIEELKKNEEYEQLEELLNSNKNSRIALCPRCSSAVFLTNRLFCSNNCFEINKIDMIFGDNFNLDNFLDLYNQSIVNSDHRNCSGRVFILNFTGGNAVVCEDCF